MKFKFLCINIWLGGKLFDELVEFIKQEDPDILAVQEAYGSNDPKLDRRYRTIEEFRNLFNFTNISFAPAMLHLTQETKIPSGNAIFSKFPILKSKTHFYGESLREETLDDRKLWPNIPRNLQHVLFKVGNTEINIFNTQGIWGEDPKDNKKRLKMSNFIVQRIKNERNVILCGDFNVDEKTDSIRKIEKHLFNIFKGKRKTSFNLKYKKKPGSGFSKSIVDFIFVSKDIKVVDVYSPNIDISDHMPLVAVLDVS